MQAPTQPGLRIGQKVLRIWYNIIRVILKLGNICE